MLLVENWDFLDFEASKLWNSNSLHFRNVNIDGFCGLQFFEMFGRVYLIWACTQFRRIKIWLGLGYLGFTKETKLERADSKPVGLSFHGLNALCLSLLKTAGTTADKNGKKENYKHFSLLFRGYKH